MQRKLNWIKEKSILPQMPFAYHLNFAQALALSKAITKVDFRKTITPPIVDQGQEGSCTYNAWAYLLGALQLKNEIEKKINSLLVFDPNRFIPFSRQFGYWCERVILGSTQEDSGATLTSGLHATQKWGCCRETTWPYERSPFEQPSEDAYLEASKHKLIIGYQLDQRDIHQLKACLLTGYPFVFGTYIYESFMKTGADGFVKNPDPTQEQLLGGHALSCFGYDDHLNGGSFIVANSWGEGWGDQGFCYIPYSVLTNPNLSADFLTARG